MAEYVGRANRSLISGDRPLGTKSPWLKIPNGKFSVLRWRIYSPIIPTGCSENVFS